MFCDELIILVVGVDIIIFEYVVGEFGSLWVICDDDGGLRCGVLLCLVRDGIVDGFDCCVILVCWDEFVDL